MKDAPWGSVSLIEESALVRVWDLGRLLRRTVATSEYLEQAALDGTRDPGRCLSQTVDCQAFVKSMDKVGPPVASGRR